MQQKCEKVGHVFIIKWYQMIEGGKLNGSDFHYFKWGPLKCNGHPQLPYILCRQENDHFISGTEYMILF